MSATSTYTPESAKWLVRTSNLKLMGPFSYGELCQLIHDRQVGLNDEVCPSNSYWFYLNERHEVKRWLGVEIPRARGGRSGDSTSGADDEDMTETDTGEGPRAQAAKTRPISVSGASGASGEAVAATEASMGEATEGTRWVKRPESLSPPAAPRRETPQVARKHAGAGFFKSFGWLLILAATLVAYALLRLSRLQ